jgi:hypothetical protein
LQRGQVDSTIACNAAPSFRHFEQVPDDCRYRDATLLSLRGAGFEVCFQFGDLHGSVGYECFGHVKISLCVRRNTNSTNFSGRLLSFQNANLFGREGVAGAIELVSLCLGVRAESRLVPYLRWD